MTDDTNLNRPDTDQTAAHDHDPLTLDMACDALGDARSRTVLRTLVERRPEFESWNAVELHRSEFITRHAVENGEERHSVFVAMHHTTFPKLEDLGFISYTADHTVAAANPTAITTACRVMDMVDTEVAIGGESA